MTVLDRLRRAGAGVFTRSPQQQMSRALAKTLGYRVLMIVVTVVVAFWFTGNTGEALSIGLVANAIKTGIYYCYERFWDRISWGVTAGE